MPYFAPSPAAQSYVGGGSLMTVAQLLATYPASAVYAGLYARVSDLWGATDEVMRCSTDGTTYFWRPQRTDYAVNNTATAGAISLIPLVTAPVQILTGTLSGAMNFTTITANAWPGAQFTVVSKGVVGLFGINISGLLGGTLPIIAGGSRTITYANGAWTGA